MLDLLPGARQALEGRVEFGEVLAQDGGGVASGIAGDEYWADGVGMFGVDDVECCRELV